MKHSISRSCKGMITKFSSKRGCDPLQGVTIPKAVTTSWQCKRLQFSPRGYNPQGHNPFQGYKSLTWEVLTYLGSRLLISMVTMCDQKAHNPSTVSVWGKGWPAWEHFTPQIHELYSPLTNQPQTNQNIPLHIVHLAFSSPREHKVYFPRTNNAKFKSRNNRWGVVSPH